VVGLAPGHVGGARAVAEQQGLGAQGGGERGGGAPGLEGADGLGEAGGRGGGEGDPTRGLGGEAGGVELIGDLAHGRRRGASRGARQGGAKWAGRIRGQPVSSAAM